jgi:hypothetical protein
MLSLFARFTSILVPQTPRTPITIGSGSSGNDVMSARDVESGYASGSSSEHNVTEVYFTEPHLKFLNQQLQKLEPEGVPVPLP